MNLIKPSSLKTGDTIGLISLAGAVNETEFVERAVKFFEERGFNVVLSDNIFAKKRYLAGDESEKINELHRFFEDETIKAIIPIRGGYGSIRLIKKINYDLIKNNPKIFCGYSDMTALSLMMLKKAGLITYTGPMIQSDFGLCKVDEFTMDNFFNILMYDKEIKLKNTDKIFNNGNAEGIFWGGNLSTLVSLCGQDFIPDEPFIFFTEDLNEPVYKIDRMFAQLFNIDKFRTNIKAIILGDFLDIDNNVWFDELFFEIAENYKIPVARGYRITHDLSKLTLPIGSFASLIDGELLIK